MTYLFDTDALSEVMRRQPNERYVDWLRSIPREEQFTSAVNIAELFEGACRSANKGALMEKIEARVLPAITVLPFDLEVARVFGEVQAALMKDGLSPGDVDVQIAATALRHGLVLVTGNIRHHERVAGLRLERALADSRAHR